MLSQFALSWKQYASLWFGLSVNLLAAYGLFLSLKIISCYLLIVQRVASAYCSLPRMANYYRSLFCCRKTILNAFPINPKQKLRLLYIRHKGGKIE